MIAESARELARLLRRTRFDFRGKVIVVTGGAGGIGGAFCRVAAARGASLVVVDLAAGRGWSVLIQGPAHHVHGPELDAVRGADVEPWAPGDRELFVRIIPSRTTGRRVSPA